MEIPINKVVKLINGNLITSKDQDAIIQSGYCGDFLSHVISRVPDKAIWFTVMNNANVAAVAKLGEVIAIVICEGIKADERLIECCKNENLTLIETPLTSFECVLKLGGHKNESLL